MTLMTQINAALAVLAVRGIRPTYLVPNREDLETLIRDLARWDLGDSVPAAVILSIRTPYGDLTVKTHELALTSGFLYRRPGKIGRYEVVPWLWAPLTASDPA